MLTSEENDDHDWIATFHQNPVFECASFAFLLYNLWSALLGYMSIEIRGLDHKVLCKIVAMYFSKQ